MVRKLVSTTVANQLGTLCGFSNKTDTIECTIVQKGETHNVRANLELLKIEDDVDARSFQEIDRGPGQGM